MSPDVNLPPTISTPIALPLAPRSLTTSTFVAAAPPVSFNPRSCSPEGRWICMSDTVAAPSSDRIGVKWLGWLL